MPFSLARARARSPFRSDKRAQLQLHSPVGEERVVDGDESLHGHGHGAVDGAHQAHVGQWQEVGHCQHGGVRVPAGVELGQREDQDGADDVELRKEIDE